MPYSGLLFGRSIRVVLPKELRNLSDFLTHLNLHQAEIIKIRYYRNKMYSHFEISKGRGKTRKISAPDKRLKFLQQRIADSLSGIYKPRNPVHGYVMGRSVKTNALSHFKRKHVINIDVKDFFPSISQKRVQGLLSAIGIDDQVADIIGTICCNNNYLPQGAPSSPILSNMICFSLDKNLMKFAKENRCIYTRYADDITFSSHQPPTLLFEVSPPAAGRFSPDLLKVELRSIFKQNGFIIHSEKAHYADRHSRRIVTGLKINEILNVDRRYVRNIRAALHSVEHLGIGDAEKKFHLDYGGRRTLAEHLRSKISFLAEVKGRSDGVVRSLTLKYNKNFPHHPIAVSPTHKEIVDRAVWVVEEDISQGTAFFLKGVGLVTAAHCVQGIDEIVVFHPSKPANTFKATIRERDEHRDLAILNHEVPATEFFELDLTSNPTQVGDQMNAVGYPDWAPGDLINIRPGVVSTMTVKSAIQLIEVTQKLSQGMSGGPLLDVSGAVAGIIHKGGPEEGRDFAIKIKVLSDWIATFHTPTPTSSPSTPSPD